MRVEEREGEREMLYKECGRGRERKIEGGREGGRERCRVTLLISISVSCTYQLCNFYLFLQSNQYYLTLLITCVLGPA